MGVRDISKSVSILAPGSRTAIDQPQAQERMPDYEQAEARLQALRDSVMATLTAATNVMMLTANDLRAMKDAAERIAQLAPAERDILQRLEKIEKAIMAPVKPVYDKSGKIIGAKREALKK